MALLIDDFVVEQLFERVDRADGTHYHYALTKDQDGWIVVFEDGEHLHTYRFPPDIWD